MKSPSIMIAMAALATGLLWTPKALAGGIFERQVHELRRVQQERKCGALTRAGTRGLRAEPWWVKNLKQEPWWSRELAPRGRHQFFRVPGGVGGYVGKMKSHRYQKGPMDRW
jgi:hypothetical protein